MVIGPAVLEKNKAEILAGGVVLSSHKLVKFAFELEGKFLSRGKAGRGKRERK
jgi:hypothetical protein